MNPPVDITALLEAWNQGDLEARDRLMPAVYDELRRRAAAFLPRERAGQALQPTALVHEVYLHLIDQDRAVWQNRAQFLAVAAEMMRRILVDRARAHKMAKRSGRWARVTLMADAMQGTQREVDVLDLNNPLDELSTFDPRKARVARTPVLRRALARRDRTRARHLSRDDDARLAGSAGMALQTPDARQGRDVSKFSRSSRVTC